MKMRGLGSAVLLALLAVSLVAAAGQEATRDNVGSVAGTVVTEAGDPVGGATIVLRGVANVALVSDADGHFGVRGLPFGTYVASARKAGFVRGSTSTGGDRVSLNSEHSDGAVVIRVQRAAVLTGRVVWPDGRPATNARVSAFCYVNGQPNQMSTRTTDDLGQFRLYGLVPRACFVEAILGSEARLLPEQRPVQAFRITWPGGEPSVATAFNLAPGEILTLGDLIADVQDQWAAAPNETGARRMTIHGRVMDARTKATVYPATVSAEDRTSHFLRVLGVDFEGRYEMQLPRGTYNLWASSPSYVEKTRGSVQVVRVTDRGRADGDGEVNLSLRQAGSIEGHVYERNGEPLEGAAVHLYRERYVQGEKRPFSEPRGATTDDRGAFRLFGVQPGAYLLSVGLNERSDLGAAVDQAALVQEETGRTFYPGGPASWATPIVVKPESAVSDVEVVWEPGSVCAVSAAILGVDGKPAGGASVRLVPTVRSGLPLEAGIEATADADGSVHFHGLDAGEYSVNARRDTDTTMEFGSALINLLPGQPETTSVAMTYPKKLVGRVVDALTGDAPADVTSLSIWAVPEDLTRFPLLPSAPRATVHPSGAFELKYLWGPMTIHVSGRNGYYLKRILAGGSDITDVPREFDEATLADGIVVEVTTEHTTLAGRVTAEDGGPVTECTVAAFETDVTKIGPWSRFVAEIPCAEDASFEDTKLPAGEYFVVAASRMDPGASSNREWTDAHKRQAKVVRLAEGSKQTVSLTLPREK